MYDKEIINLIDKFAQQGGSKTMKYYQWKSTDSRTEKVNMSDTVDNIFIELKNQISTSYFCHKKAGCYVHSFH